MPMGRNITLQRGVALLAPAILICLAAGATRADPSDAPATSAAPASEDKWVKPEKSQVLAELARPTSPKAADRAARDLTFVARELTLEELRGLLARAATIDAEVEAMIADEVVNSISADPHYAPDPVSPPANPSGGQCRRPDIFAAMCDSLRAEPAAAGLEAVIDTIEAAFADPEDFWQPVFYILISDDPEVKSAFVRIHAGARRADAARRRGGPHSGDSLRSLLIADLEAAPKGNPGVLHAARQVIDHLSDEQLEHLLDRLLIAGVQGLTRALDNMRAAGQEVTQSEKRERNRRDAEKRIARAIESELGSRLRRNTCASEIAAKVADAGGPYFFDEIDAAVKAHPGIFRTDGHRAGVYRATGSPRALAPLMALCDDAAKAGLPNDRNAARDHEWSADQVIIALGGLTHQLARELEPPERISLCGPAVNRLTECVPDERLPSRARDRARYFIERIEQTCPDEFPAIKECMARNPAATE